MSGTIKKTFPTQPDPHETSLTRKFIEKRIRQATGGDAYVIEDLVNNLILREIHDEKVRDLKEALRVQPPKDGGDRLGPPMVEKGSHPAVRPPSQGREESPVTSPSPKWDIPTQIEELKFVLAQKDKIMEKKDDDYAKLKKILADTQNDLQSLLDLNSHYLEIISQFTRVQQNNNANQRSTLSNAEEDRDLEQELEESEKCIADLQGELAEIQEELDQRETDLVGVLEREGNYKEMLGLKPEATSREVEKRIRKIVDDGSLQKREIDKVKKELRKVMHTKASLEEKISALARQKETVDFHKRQQELTMKKMSRMKQKAPVTQRAQSAIKTALSTQEISGADLPVTEKPAMHLRLPQTLTYHRMPQYCMMCREMFTPLKHGESCKTHFKRYKGGAWMCCGENRIAGGGCLVMPHLYIELTVDKKIFITDGANYMQL